MIFRHGLAKNFTQIGQISGPASLRKLAQIVGPPWNADEKQVGMIDEPICCGVGA
jgi:hypothetical protein